MLTIYPSNWKEIATRIKLRDGNKCTICFSTKRLEVHHTRESSDPKNLITLCYMCHKGGANSYCGFKKKIRLYNDIRLDDKLSQEEKLIAHSKLIREIREYYGRVQNVRLMIKKKEHNCLSNFR
ncbi:hypothetical protein HY500_03315 [Candidatus Woesearchaeota archaeon]|nr:hypothetical protein [Candidatus Woesearchaeota archaeon]